MDRLLFLCVCFGLRNALPFKGLRQSTLVGDLRAQSTYDKNLFSTCEAQKHRATLPVQDLPVARVLSHLESNSKVANYSGVFFFGKFLFLYDKSKITRHLVDHSAFSMDDPMGSSGHSPQKSETEP